MSSLSTEQIDYINNLKISHPDITKPVLVDLLRSATWNESAIEEALIIYNEDTQSSVKFEPFIVNHDEAGKKNKIKVSIFFGIGILFFALIFSSVYFIFQKPVLDRTDVGEGREMPTNASIELVQTIKVDGTIKGDYANIRDIRLLYNGEIVYHKIKVPEDSKKKIFPESSLFVNNEEITDVAKFGPSSPVKEINGVLTYLVNTEETVFDGVERRDNFLIGEIYKLNGPHILRSGSQDIAKGYFMNFLEVGGKLAYVYKESPESPDILVYDDEEIARAEYIVGVKDLGGKLFYVIYDYPEQGPGGSTYDRYQRIFYDGDEVVMYDHLNEKFSYKGSVLLRIGSLTLVNGKWAFVAYYSIDSNPVKWLVHEGLLVDVATGTLEIAPIADRLVYQRSDDLSDNPILIVDGEEVGPPGDKQVFSVGGEIGYIMSIPDNEDYLISQKKLYLDGVELASVNFRYSNRGSSGEFFSEVQDVAGKLMYKVTSLDESNDSIFYDGENILSADMIGSSFQTIADDGKIIDPQTPFYFYGANEENGVTTFSIYKIK
jgi:hypothetical protein